MDCIKEKIKNMLDNEELLIDYGVFTNELKDICYFVIDDEDEINELELILTYIKATDKNAQIFCSTYGVDNTEKEPYIYCDNLWICSNIFTVKTIQELFAQFDTAGNDLRTLVPSSVMVLSNEDIDENLVYYIDGDCILHKYVDESPIKDANNILSIYWD